MCWVSPDSLSSLSAFSASCDLGPSYPRHWIPLPCSFWLFDQCETLTGNEKKGEERAWSIYLFPRFHLFELLWIDCINLPKVTVPLWLFSAQGYPLQIAIATLFLCQFDQRVFTVPSVAGPRVVLGYACEFPYTWLHLCLFSFPQITHLSVHYVYWWDSDWYCHLYFSIFYSILLLLLLVVILIFILHTFFFFADLSVSQINYHFCSLSSYNSLHLF